MEEKSEISEKSEIKNIELSLAACRVLRPVYSNPLDGMRDDFASKILQRMK